MDLFIPLQKSLQIPLYEQLYDGIKRAILAQQLTKHSRLPSKRQLADYLSISQTTVELAYAQLLAEGYITSTPRVGFFVEDIGELPIIERPTLQKKSEPQELEKQYTYNLSPSNIDALSFPFEIWRKFAKQVIDEMNASLVQIGHRQGEEILRDEIASYLYQSRGIECSKEQIVIGSGTEQLLPIILRLLDEPTSLAMETPGYSPMSINPVNAVIPIEIDDDGIRVDLLEQSDASIVYVTPSHQFPTGAVLSATRRALLLAWANEVSTRYIIEDDYDSEFRYVGKPIASLKSMDHNQKVIYMSTFTKSLMPSLRVAYFVLPESLVARYKERLHYYTSTVPRFEQHILAQFMKSGHFAKHLNKMRKIYRKKHDKMIQTFKSHYPEITISGADAGMHFIITIHSVKNEQQLIKQALQANIFIRTVSSYGLKKDEQSSPSFLIGFGDLQLEKIEDAVHTLMNALK